MLKNPAIRLALYLVGVLALVVVSTLNGRHLIDDATAGSISSAINLIAQVLGLGGLGVAAASNIRQRTNGTFDVSGGSPAEQLAQAAKNYAQQRAADEAALDAVLASVPGGHQIADAITGAVGTVSSVSATAADTVGDVVTACGDALRG